MLTTDDINQLRIAPCDVNASTTVWRAVSFELGIPYVFFTYSPGLDPAGILDTLVLWAEEDVLDFCESFLGNRSKKILDISLLLLNYEGDEPYREMVRLQELWIEHRQDSDERYPIYIALNGERVGQVRENDYDRAELKTKLLYSLHGNSKL